MADKLVECTHCPWGCNRFTDPQYIDSETEIINEETRELAYNCPECGCTTKFSGY